jgi:hypothetical protein
LVKRLPNGKNSFLLLLQDASINDWYCVACGLPEVVDLTTAIAEQSSAKQKADAQIAAQDATKRPKHGPLSGKFVEEQTYWDSSKAKKLFLGKATNSRGVVDVLEQQIERLQQSNRTVDGWKDVIDKHGEDNLCSSFNIIMGRGV